VTPERRAASTRRRATTRDDARQRATRDVAQATARDARYERRRRASLDGGSKIIFANGARDDAKRREAGATRRDGTKSARAGEVVDGAVGAGGDARSRADAGGAMIRRLGWAFEATAARGCPV